MFTHTLLNAGLLPLVVSASIAFVMRRMRSPPQIVWAAAFACGFLAGRFALNSQAGFADALNSFVQPHEAADWLPLVVLIALGVSVVMMLGGPFGQRRQIALAAALCLAVPVRLLSGNVRLTHHWSAIEKLAYLALLAATLGLVWLLLASEGDEKHSLLRVPLLILVAIGTAIVLYFSGVFVYALSSGAVAAAITGTALACMFQSGATGSASAWRRLSFPGIHGAAAVITFSLGSLILLGHFYAELTPVNATLLFISLAATGAPLPEFIRSGPAWQQLAARTALCLLPLAIALARTVG